MTDLRTSVIIVSRHRTAALLRAITSLRQQDHANFELIVVADPAAISDVALDVKKISFDEANISAARNLGLAAAAADIVAFIDDDAVAEPTWLRRLTAPFANPDVMASTGFVRGRNGISMQWRACEVDPLGQDHPLDVTGLTLRGPTSDRVVKTQGTNCAFRGPALRAIGGFDPAYRFYLDEADVNFRMACLTAIVPDAEVHHGYFASARRSKDRLPISLFDIGASTAVFLRRHADEVSATPLIAQQSARLTAWQKAGKITATQAQDLMETLTLGWQEGLTRDLRTPLALPNTPPDFLPLGGIGPRSALVLAGRIWSRKSLRKRAELAVAQGQIATVICLSPTRRAHWVEFDPAGFWWQQGGIWGRADRSDPRIIWGNFSRRVAQEIARLATVRPITRRNKI